jgi:hypothetical protein
MQIHELTKTPRRTDEGILDSIKSAVGLDDKSVNKAQDKYWNKNQDEINKSAQKSAAALAKKGFDVNPHNLPLSAADTPKNIAAGTAGTRSRNDTDFQKQVRYKHLKSLFIKNFVGPNPRPTPESADSTILNELMDIQRDFQPWINSEIPELFKVTQDPTAKANLDQAYRGIVAAKNNSTALTKAFDKYSAIAKNYIDNLPQVNRTPQAASSSQNTQFLSPADYQQSEQLSRELEQYGIGPEATKKVAQALKNKTFTPTGFINAIEKAARGS